jgi:DNA-binding transcriptional ArsR family regulator
MTLCACLEAGPFKPPVFSLFSLAIAKLDIAKYNYHEKEIHMSESAMKQMRRNVAEVSEFLRSLANESRLLLLCALLDGEQSVGELNAHVDLSPSALSQHLAWLREGGLVKTRRDAQTIYYSLADKRVKEVLAVLKKQFCK